MRFRLFGGNGKEQVEDIEGVEDYMEVDHTPENRGKLGIRVERLEDFSDTERVLKSVRDGNIVFLRIRSLKDRDLGELKRAVERLKKSVVANNGDIIGVEQDWLILTPEHAMVHRDSI